MKIPDYVSPIVGYRVWSWNDPNLASLNGSSWPQGQPLKATCAVSTPITIDCDSLSHEAPKSTCRCGIYAMKSPDLLHGLALRKIGIEGEVFLWGTVVEHEVGWRAQYAYPKSLVVSREMIPYGAKNAESFLAALVSYGADVLLSVAARNLVLWTKRTGYGKDGLNVLRQVANTVHRVRVAILSDRRERVSVLAQQFKLSENAEVVFGQAIFPLLTGRSHAVLRHLRHQRARLVLVDSQNLEDDLSSMRALGEWGGDVAIIAIAPAVDTHVMAVALHGGLDGILSDADVRNLTTHLRDYGWSWRSKWNLNFWSRTLTHQALSQEGKK